MAREESREDRSGKSGKDKERHRSRKRDEEDSGQSSDQESSDDARGRKRKMSRDTEDKKRSKRKRRDEEDSEDDDSSSSESSEDSEDDRRRRKERRKKRQGDKDEKRKKRKERRREKDGKRKRGGKDEESSDDEKRKKKKLLKEAKKFLQKHDKKTAMVPVGTDVEFIKISDDDYFNKNQELATWLREERQIFFSALSAEESREFFKEFVVLWNGGQLSEKYYKGIEKAPRTGHNWAIKRRPDDQIDPLDDDARRASLQIDRKRFRKEQEVALDVMLPKSTGREAMLEKKAARRAANKEREWSPEPMKEGEMMGGGDDFQSRLARDRAWREKKANARASVMMDKQAAFQEKENAKMDQLKALVDLAGGRISIPKRND